MACARQSRSMIASASYKAPLRFPASPGTQSDLGRYGKNWLQSLLLEQAWLNARDSHNRLLCKVFVMIVKKPAFAASRIARQRHPDMLVRRSMRVVAMLGELHKAGYQRLRAMPFMSPSGTSWRFWIAPVDLFHRNHGAIAILHRGELASEPRLMALVEGMACYTSGQADQGDFFGWADAAEDGARDLAAKFIERFSIIAEAGEGWDYAYAGWFQRVLGMVEAGFFPIVIADMMRTSSRRISVSDLRPATWGKLIPPELPLPPPGEYPHDYPYLEDCP
jgi:hypothetical protein